jgi:hypothetical protein
MDINPLKNTKLSAFFSADFTTQKQQTSVMSIGSPNILFPYYFHQIENQYFPLLQDDLKSSLSSCFRIEIDSDKKKIKKEARIYFSVLSFPCSIFLCRIKDNGRICSDFINALRPQNSSFHE